MNTQEIKKEIKQLKKLKLKCRAGSKERIELYRQIKALKEQLDNNFIDNKDKQIIIDKILKLDKVMASIEIDLTKHSIENLKKYLKKLEKGEHNV